MTGRATTARWALLGLALVAAASVPAFAGTYYVRIFTGIFMFGALASGWNLIGGYAGYADFGAAAFLGIGAYTTGIAMVNYHAPFAVALAAGAALAVAAAVGIGALLLRLRGHYFAIATLGFMLVLQQVAANLEVTGGGSGMNLPPVRSFTGFYYWMLGVLVVGVVAGVLLPRSRAGYALAAIRENQDAARVLGIRPLPFKILAYAGSAFFFAVVGGLYAYWFTFIDPPTVFNADFTIQAIVMTLFGGAGTALGPVLGALILKSIDTALGNTFVFFHDVFFGVLVCLLVICAPHGVVELLQTPRRLVRVVRTGLQESRV
jgi:branched-chain amino acid transport system permease protein